MSTRRIKCPGITLKPSVPKFKGLNKSKSQASERLKKCKELEQEL